MLGSSVVQPSLTLLSGVIMSIGVSVEIAGGALLDGARLGVNLSRQPTEQNVEQAVTAIVVVGPGVELEGFGERTDPDWDPLVDIDLSDARIEITLVNDQPLDFKAVLQITDALGEAGPISAININPATNWAGFVPTRLIGSSTDAVLISLGQLAGLAGQKIVLDLVPEPASGALAAAAGAVMAAAGRRRKE